jgi:hypothetical protein
MKCQSIKSTCSTLLDHFLKLNELDDAMTKKAIWSVVALFMIFTASACSSIDASPSTMPREKELLNNIKTIADHGDMTDYEFIEKMLNIQLRAERPEFYMGGNGALVEYRRTLKLKSFPSDYVATGFYYSYDPEKDAYKNGHFSIRFSEHICLKSKDVRDYFSASMDILAPHLDAVSYKYVGPTKLTATIQFYQARQCASGIAFLQERSKTTEDKNMVQPGAPIDTPE